MTITWGKRERTKVASVIDQEWENVEDAAEAVLAEALSLLEKRAKFTVVGQLYYSRQEGGWIGPEDARAAKVCLGYYSTPGDAQEAAQSLVYQSATHEEFKTWVLPVEHSTPAEVYAKRKAAHQAAEAEVRKAKVVVSGTEKAR